MDVLQDHIDVCATEQPKLPNLLCQARLGSATERTGYRGAVTPERTATEDQT